MHDVCWDLLQDKDHNIELHLIYCTYWSQVYENAGASLLKTKYARHGSISLPEQ